MIARSCVRLWSRSVTARTLHNCGKLEVERAALYTVALRCKWAESRSRSGVPQEVRPVVPATTSSRRLSFRARGSHCHVLTFPLTHRGCPPNDFWVYVGVPVSGTCSTVRVQENVGGGGRLQVVWMYASFEASFFTKRVPEPTTRTTPNPIHSNRRATYASG